MERDMRDWKARFAGGTIAVGALAGALARAARALQPVVRPAPAACAAPRYRDRGRAAGAQGRPG